MNEIYPSLIHSIEDVTRRIEPDRLFSHPDRPLEIELGSGDGSFLFQIAQASPDRNFIGVERLLGRIRKLDKRAVRERIQNLRLIRIEAAYFLTWLVPEQSVDVFHLYFPDPWPKRRHRKNRLVQEGFPEAVRAGLKSRGAIYLRTDDRDYHERMRKLFEGHPAFETAETPESILAIKTDFESDFNSQGIPTLALAYRKME